MGWTPEEEGKDADCDGTFSFQDAAANARVQLAGRGDTSGPQTSLKASLADCVITVFRKQN